jgi:hypothetical protein
VCGARLASQGASIQASLAGPAAGATPKERGQGQSVRRQERDEKMTDSPESAFHAYIQAFEALDPETALPFYDLPCMFIAPQGVFAAPDIDTARALLSQFMGQLRTQSYRRTEVVGFTVRKFSLNLASCAGTFVRLNTGDGEIARLGFTYIMRNAGSWKIVVAALHEPVVA